MRRSLKILAAAAAVVLPALAGAQANPRALGWNVFLQGQCNVGCTQYTVDFHLVNLQPTDNGGVATPAPILALGSDAAYGFVKTASLRFQGPGSIVPGTVGAVPPTFIASVVPGFQQINLLDLGGFLTGTYSAGRQFQVTFNVAGGPIRIVSAEGFAYINNQGDYFNAAGADVGQFPTTNGQPSYIGGDFSIAVNTAPEPATVALMGTGLLSLIGAGVVRRRNQA